MKLNQQTLHKTKEKQGRVSPSSHPSFIAHTVTAGHQIRRINKIRNLVELHVLTPILPYFVGCLFVWRFPETHYSFPPKTWVHVSTFVLGYDIDILPSWKDLLSLSFLQSYFCLCENPKDQSTSRMLAFLQRTSRLIRTIPKYITRLLVLACLKHTSRKLFPHHSVETERIRARHPSFPFDRPRYPASRPRLQAPATACTPLPTLPKKAKAVTLLQKKAIPTAALRGGEKRKTRGAPRRGEGNTHGKKFSRTTQAAGYSPLRRTLPDLTCTKKHQEPGPPLMSVQ